MLGGLAVHRVVSRSPTSSGVRGVSDTDIDSKVSGASLVPEVGFHLVGVGFGVVLTKRMY